MRTALTISLVLLSCWRALAAVAVEPPRQAGELSCLRLLTLKDIYDSGFRPYRVGWGLCCVGKADIRLKLPGVNQFVPFGVDSVSFSIDKNDAVTRIDIMTPGMPVEQAGAMINELVRSLNSVPQGLDEALARAAIDNPKWAHATWTQDWSNEWASGRIGFEPLTYYVNDASKGYLEMKAIVHVGIKWNKTEIGPTYRETPVTPPKGYEHISMEIPSSDVVKKAQSSDDPSLAHLRHRDEKTSGYFREQTKIDSGFGTEKSIRNKHLTDTERGTKINHTMELHRGIDCRRAWSCMVMAQASFASVSGLVTKNRAS